MNIVPANESHIPGMIGLLQQVGEVHHQIRPDLFRAGAQKYDEAALKRLLQDPTRPIFIAEMDGQVAGYAFCILQEAKNDPVLRDRKVLYIDDLCVDEGHRGQGIAGELYRHACGYAREQGCQFITLNVWEGNSALQFYEKMGMKPRKVFMDLPLED